jgi:hypothetical protein
MPRLLVKEITSVGAVEEGDNPGAEILFFKRKDHKATEVAKESRTTAETEEASMARPDLSSLDDEVRAPLETYLDELEAQQPVVEPDPEEVVKAAPEEVQEIIAKQASELEELQKQADEDRKELETEIAKRRTAEFTDLAKSYEAVTGPDAGPHLDAIEASVPTETFDWLKERLNATAAVLEADTVLTKAIGGDTSGDRLESLVKAKMDSDPDLTVAQARSKVWRENPDLVEEVRS